MLSVLLSHAGAPLRHGWPAQHLGLSCTDAPGKDGYFVVPTGWLEMAGSDEFSVGQSHAVVALGEVQVAIVKFMTSRLCVAPVS